MRIEFKAGTAACNLIVHAADPMNTYPEVIALLVKRYNDVACPWEWSISMCTPEEETAFHKAVDIHVRALE